MGPKVEVVISENVMPDEVTTPHTRPHGNSPMIDTSFNSAQFDFTISFTPLQPIPPTSLSIPFGTISTPISKQLSISVTITTPTPTISVTIPILIPTISESTITTTVPIIYETTTTTTPITTVTNLPQIPQILLSQILNPNESIRPEQTPTIKTEQPFEPTPPPIIEPNPLTLNQINQKTSLLIQSFPHPLHSYSLSLKCVLF
ncbi:uncharacterized protein LOC127094724 [Lathyrus oleraceus]|uniref:uncharacterized protein LOC127094724 n=1 Tax=Pisum sativum TaxID=3888 RepID=UPI0021D3ADEE|nr:uncharacterized protein LOC127094724 [Pisum sativum]